MYISTYYCLAKTKNFLSIRIKEVRKGYSNGKWVHIVYKCKTEIGIKEDFTTDKILFSKLHARIEIYLKYNQNIIHNNIVP